MKNKTGEDNLMSSKKIPENEELEIEREETPSAVKPKLGKDDIAAEELFSSSGERPVDASSISEETDTEKLKEKLVQAEERYLRLAAEFDNYKRRNVRQFDETIQNAEHEIFRQILEIVDNFKRAVELPENQKNFGAFQSGMKMIYEQMKRFLEKHKIEPIKAIGQKFDPEFHEAVMQIESDEHPEGTVASELGGGFKRGDKIIRHAKVGVSKGKERK